MTPSDFDEDTDKEIHLDELEAAAHVADEATFVHVSYPCLEIVSGPGEGRRYYVREGDNEIGRTSGSQIVLKDSSISRHHALIVRRGDEFHIRDLGSRNRTSIGGIPLEDNESRPLRHLTRLSMGIYELRLLTDDPPAEEAEPLQSASPSPSPDITPPPAPEEAETSAPVEEERSEVSEAVVPSKADGVEEKPVVVAPSAPSALFPPSEMDEITNHGIAKADRRKLILGISAIGFLVLLVMAGIWFFRSKDVTEPVAPPLAELPSETPPSTPPAEAPVPPTKPAFESFPAPVEEPGKKVTSVFLQIDSTPLPVAVSLDGQPLGTTPLQTNVDVEIGKPHTVKAHYRLEEVGESFEVEKTFQVEQGQDKVSLAFSADLATIKFTELPPDVSVYLEASFEYDQYKSRSIKLESITYGKPFFVPYGQYIIELRGLPPDRQSGIGTADEILYRRSFVLNKENATHVMTVAPSDLSKFSASITSKPSGADIYYDDKKIGTTPWQGDLAVGKHSLVIKKQGFEDLHQNVEMWRNEFQEISATLKTSPAGSLIFRARTAYQNQSYQKALDLLSQALDQTPTEGEKKTIHYWLGQTYQALGSCDKSINYYTLARDSSDWRHEASLGLAQCSETLGDKTKALLYLADILLSTQDQALIAQAEKVFHQVSPIRSVVYLNTEPTGAVVVVNKQAVDNRTPVLLTDLGAGTYQLVVQYPGYGEETMDIHVKLSEFRPIFLKLKPLQ